MGLDINAYFVQLVYSSYPSLVNSTLTVAVYKNDKPLDSPLYLIDGLCNTCFISKETNGIGIHFMTRDKTF